MNSIWSNPGLQSIRPETGDACSHILHTRNQSVRHTEKVCTLLPHCHIEVLTARGNESAPNLNTTKLLCSIITSSHFYLRLNWWLVNVYHCFHHTTSNNASMLGPSPVTPILACNHLQPSAALSDYTYILFSLHGYYSWTVWPCRWFWNITNYLPSDGAPCHRNLNPHNEQTLHKLQDLRSFANTFISLTWKVW
jgi:hypothetical protein